MKLIQPNEPTPPMTPRGVEIYNFIVDFYNENAYGPTLGEIGRHFKIGKTTVFQHVDRLIAQGRIVKGPYRRRGLVPVADSRDTLLEEVVEAWDSGSARAMKETVERVREHNATAANAIAAQRAAASGNSAGGPPER